MATFIPKRAAAKPSASDTNVAPNELVIVARLGVAYGLKGWIKLHPFSHAPDALEHAAVCWIAPYLPNQTDVPQSAWQAVRLKGFKPHSDAWVAEFHEWAGRTDAENHKGWQVAVARADFPTTDDDEFYWVDLIGASVLNQDGVTLGKVHSLLESAAHPVMQIIGDGVEYLIPFVGVFVGKVDVAAKVINVQWDVDATA
jgi:16S rRNA processing protein RimM